MDEHRSQRCIKFAQFIVGMIRQTRDNTVSKYYSQLKNNEIECVPIITDIIGDTFGITPFITYNKPVKLFPHLIHTKYITTYEGYLGLDITID